MVQNNFNNQVMTSQMGQPQGGQVVHQARKNIDILLIIFISIGLGLATVVIFSIIYAIMRNSDFQRTIDIGKKIIDLMKSSSGYSSDYSSYEKIMSSARGAQTFNFLGLAFQVIIAFGMGGLLFFAINKNKKLCAKIGLVLAFTFFVLSLGKMMGLLVDGFELYSTGGYFAEKEGLKYFSENNLPKYATHPGVLATMMFFVSVGWAGVVAAFYFLDKNLEIISHKIKEKRAMNAVRMQQQSQISPEFNPAGQAPQQTPQGFNPAGQAHSEQK